MFGFSHLLQIKDILKSFLSLVQKKLIGLHRTQNKTSQQPQEDVVCCIATRWCLMWMNVAQCLGQIRGCE